MAIFPAVLHIPPNAPADRAMSGSNSQTTAPLIPTCPCSVLLLLRKTTTVSTLVVVWLVADFESRYENAPKRRACPISPNPRNLPLGCRGQSSQNFWDTPRTSPWDTPPPGMRSAPRKNGGAGAP